MKKWSGVYDSSDGQTVIFSDAQNFSLSLKKALNDSAYLKVSAQLRQQIRDPIEVSTGQKLRYEILADMNLEFINKVVLFIDQGVFTIN